MSKLLPPNPSVRNLRNQAKTLLKSHNSGSVSVCETYRLIHRFSGSTDQEILQAAVSLQETQYALALSYGFNGWKEMKVAVAAMAAASGTPSAGDSAELPGKRPLAIGSIINEALTMLGTSLPEDVEIEVNIGKEAGMVFGDPTQLRQVIVDLAMNASHAMAETGGVVTIVLESTYIDETTAVHLPDMPAGSYTRLTVSDVGHGIEPRFMEHIFKPYFTTRNEGSGFGLPVVHGIIKQHGGWIRVSSEAGKGTAFDILFPEIPSSEDQAASPESETPSAGTTDDRDEDRSETIESARAYIERIKTDSEFRDRVKTAEDKAARIALVNAEGFDFDLEDIAAATAELPEDELGHVLGPAAKDTNLFIGERWQADIAFVGMITEGMFY